MKLSKARTKVRSQILDEASQWLVEFQQGDVDARGREEFNTWLRRSPEHVQAYLQVAALWEDAPLLAKSREVGAAGLIERALADDNVVAVSESARSTAARGEESTVSAASARSVRTGRRHLAFAAVALLVVIATIGGYQLQRAGTYATAVGEQRSVRLSDGSMVEINSRSRVRVRFEERERRVELLQGQALFTVAPDHARPFVVHAGAMQVRAVGTRFDVDRRSSRTVVTVLEGRVAIDAAGANATPDTRPDVASEREPAPVLLAAGQRLSIASMAAAATPETVDVAAATAWTRREIVFQSSPLSEVIEEFNRYNARKMVLADPRLQGTRISGIFSSTDPSSLLRFLRQLPHVDVQEAPDEIRIARK